MMNINSILHECSDNELTEAAKCKKDILYFADNYIQLFLPNGTYGNVKLRPYQRKYLKMLQAKRQKCLLTIKPRLI